MGGWRVGGLTKNCQPLNATSDIRPRGDPGPPTAADLLRPKSTDAARRVGEAIWQGVKILGAHPRLGRMVDDLPEEFREWLIDFGDSGYVVRYRIDDDAVTIKVRHQKEAGYY